MLPLLDGDIRRPHLADAATRLDQARLAGEFAGLAVIEDQHIDPGDQADQLLLRDVDPEIHGVRDDKMRTGQLIQDMMLERRGDISEQDHP